MRWVVLIRLWMVEPLLIGLLREQFVGTQAEEHPDLPHPAPTWQI
jgi:hypothetical protein